MSEYKYFINRTGEKFNNRVSPELKRIITKNIKSWEKICE